MIRITPQHNSSAVSHYFDPAQHGDYYDSPSEMLGRWSGKGASELGLSGFVRPEDFKKLANNINPVNDNKLTPRQRPGRKVGFDATFSAPKGVTLLLELTGDDRIMDVFNAARDATLREMEDSITTRDQRGGKAKMVETGNFICASFTHRTSRPVTNGSMPHAHTNEPLPGEKWSGTRVDPHLHTHAFIFNASRNGDRWTAIEIKPTKTTAPFYEQRFLARMSRGLGELGYQTKRKGRYFEMDGIPEKTLKKFSNRTALIEAVAESKGITNPKFKAELGGKTRERKKDTPPVEDMRAEWRSRLTDGEVARLQNLWHKATGEKTNAKSLTVAASLERDAENWLRKRQGVAALPEPRKPEPKKKRALFLNRVVGMLKRAREARQPTQEIDYGYGRR